VSGSYTPSGRFRDATPAEVSQQFEHFRRGDAVDHRGGCATPLHQARMKEDLQVFRRGRLLRPGRIGDLSDRLFSSTEDREDADAGAIAERARPRSDQVDLFT
jgi:hypothetical protein